MPIPDFAFLADDITWAEVPIILWIVGATVVMVVLNIRFGWDRARAIIAGRRVLLGATLVVAVMLAIALYLMSGQPLPMYL